MRLLSAFPGGSDGKESSGNVGDLGSIPGLGRSPGEGNVYPLQYSGLENPMDYTVAWSWTRLSNFHFSDLKGQVHTWKAGFKCRILRVYFENTEEEPNLDLQPGLLIFLIPHHCTPWGSCEHLCGHPSPHIQDLPTSSRIVIPLIPTNSGLFPAAEFTLVWWEPRDGASQSWKQVWFPLSRESQVLG